MKTTTAENDPQAYKKLRDLIDEIEVAMITTVTHDGALHSRPMVTLRADEDGSIWFFTADDSGKAHDLEEEHAVNLSYADPKRRHYVSVSGSASVVHDTDKARELWKPALSAYFPRGLDDPHLALMCVKIESADYWDAPATGFFHREKGEGGRNGKTDDHHTRVDVRATPASG
jgi:general stress protein 26